MLLWCPGVRHGCRAVQCNTVRASAGREHGRNLLHRQRGCWSRTRTKLTASTTRLCMTSVSVHSNSPLRPTVTSTTSSLPPCLVSPHASASRARYEFTTSLQVCTRTGASVSSDLKTYTNPLLRAKLALEIYLAVVARDC